MLRYPNLSRRYSPRFAHVRPIFVILLNTHSTVRRMPGGKVVGRFPAERAENLAGVNGIAAIVSGAVSYVSD